MNDELRVCQPAWLGERISRREPPVDDDGRLDEVLALARENVERGTGGPFAAAVYGEHDGARLSVAVNVVVPSHCAIAHAETMALALAQQAVGDFSLASRGVVLVSSAEPCGMCTGAIAWSGIARLLFAAGRRDVEAIGFDEGPRPARWREALARYGVRVAGPCRRAEARAVLAAYVAAGGRRYNGR